MSRGAFWTGIAIAAVVATAMALDLVDHASAPRGPVLPRPEGFHMNLRGLGPLELAFAGRVQLVTDRREEEESGGGATRVPRWQVLGNDPTPEGAGMSIRDTHIEAMPHEGESAAPIAADTPRAWIALARDRGLLTLDMDRPWRLETPVLDLPGFRGGTRMRATAYGMAELHPRDQWVRARGRFRLDAENLSLEAADFRYDALTGRMEFAPWHERVDWSFRDSSGAVLHGTSDAGGEIIPLEEGVLLLRFAEGPQGVRAELPSGKNLAPGWLFARSLDLRLAQRGEGTWTPRFALARGPLLISDPRLVFEGGDAELTWTSIGELTLASITGPVAARPWDASFQTATARDRANFDPLAGTLTLDGRAWVSDARGFFAADSLAWDGENLHGSGDLLAHTAQGTAFADQAMMSERSGIAAEGAVRLLPVNGMLNELSGPNLTLTPTSEARMEKGFLATGERESALWTISGERLVSRPDETGRPRVEADGSLHWSEPGLDIRADRFRQLDEEHFRLEGAPASAWMELKAGGRAEATFRRAELFENRLRIEGDPVLLLPAAALGLSGEPVRLQARSVERDMTTGAWLLEGSVRAEGSLRTQADRARWSPTEGLWIERSAAAPIVEGELADGRSFRGQGKKFGIDAENNLVLEGAAQGRLTDADGQTHEFWADRIRAGATGGEATGQVRAESPLGKGRGDQVVWTSVEGHVVHIEVTGDAFLERADISARGKRIVVDEVTGWIESEGIPGQPAWLRWSDGREIQGEWLRYNSLSQLFESRSFRLDTPPSPAEPSPR